MTTIIREMTEADAEEIWLFLRKHFYGQDPLTQIPGYHTAITDELRQREYRLSLLRQGTSLVAIDKNDGDRIVGIAFAGVMHSSDIEEDWNRVNQHKPTKLTEHMHYFLAGIERNAQLFEHCAVSDALYLHILTVDASMRCQGLGRRLVTAMMNVGREKQLPLLVATCTSAYSTRLMAALGMECVYSEAYVDYKDEDGRIVLQPPAPHTEISVMALQL